jgi:hypothetical protein
MPPQNPTFTFALACRCLGCRVRVSLMCKTF